MQSIAEQRYLKRSQDNFYTFCVGECWDNDRTVDDWLGEVNSYTDNPISAFDFPLHYLLQNVSDSFGFSLKNLAAGGNVVDDYPQQAVTFVDNHDTIRDPNNAINSNKLMAYSFILTHEGYPCVFWMDWYNFNLAMTATPNGIAALVAAHEKYAGGATRVLYADDNLYVMQRSGSVSQPGLIYVLNNLGDAWNGTIVQTQWSNVQFQPVAYGGQDNSAPQGKTTSSDGHADFWAAPLGWAVYAPQV